MKTRRMAGIIGLVLGMQVVCFGFTIDTTSRYTTGPLTFSKDTVFTNNMLGENIFGNGFVDTIKITNTTNDTLKINIVSFYWDTTKTQVWQLRFVAYHLDTYPYLNLLGEYGFLNDFEELPQVITLLKGEGACLYYFLLDWNTETPTGKKTAQQPAVTQKIGDTIILNMVLLTNVNNDTIKDTLTMIGVIGRGPLESIKNAHSTLQPVLNNVKNVSIYYSLTGQKIGTYSGNIPMENTLAPGLYIVKSINLNNQQSVKYFLKQRR